jgi:hypothetical protein
MKKKLSRLQFCSLVGITSHNLDNRARANQLSLAFGLQAPAVLGEYHPLDVFCHKLADALVERGFVRETATAILREHNETWLLALTKAESHPSAEMVAWEPSGEMFDLRHAISREQKIYFAVAREKDAKSGAETYHAAQGLPEEALAALGEAMGEKPAADMVFVRIPDVLSDTLDAFKKTGLFEWLMEGEPEPFTRRREHPEFAEWRAEIERLRQQSIDRLKTRDRVKRERRSAVRKAMAKIQRENA